MRRYLRVLGVFYKAALLTDLEYRANFVTHLVLSAIGIVWSVAGVPGQFRNNQVVRLTHICAENSGAARVR